MLPALSRRCAWLFLVALVAAVDRVLAQLGGPPKPDAQLILAAAKAASGGAAWDKLVSQHSKVTIHTGGFSGTAERWSDVSTGRSLIRFSVGPVSGASGFDGKVAWSQDETGKSQVEADATSRELAVNAAYRDRLGFWYPERAPRGHRLQGDAPKPTARRSRSCASRRRAVGRSSCGSTPRPS